MYFTQISFNIIKEYRHKHLRRDQSNLILLKFSEKFDTINSPIHFVYTSDFSTIRVLLTQMRVENHLLRKSASHRCITVV